MAQITCCQLSGATSGFQMPTLLPVIGECMTCKRQQNKLRNSLMQKGIKWLFNRPYGAHQGGVREWQVQQVKRGLCTVVGQQVLDDEALRTALCEVEAVLNDRLITPSSGDLNDLEALTPDHLLQFKAKTLLSPGLFIKKRSIRLQALEASPIQC